MNQDQNNLNLNNFNTQGNNGIPNNQPLNNQSFNNTLNQGIQQNSNGNQQTFNPQPQTPPNYQQTTNQMNMQQPTPHPMNSFENGNASNQNLNTKPPKKMSLGLIIGIVVAVVAVVGGILLFSNMGNNDNGDSSSGGSNKENSNVDLSIDESISKTITCSLVGEALYAKDTTYSYEYILPNWNRYTFIKEYEPEYTNESGKVYVVDYDKECKENKKIDNSTVYTNDFKLSINYKVDKYSSASWKNIKEKATDTLLYTNAGSPTLYGNKNGYWFSHMQKASNLLTGEDDSDELEVFIYKEVNKFENAHTTARGDVVGDEYHALLITIRASYENEVGKVRLNYLLNDLKDALTEKYDLDLSELTIDLIKK